MNRTEQILRMCVAFDSEVRFLPPGAKDFAFILRFELL